MNGLCISIYLIEGVFQSTTQQKLVLANFFSERATDFDVMQSLYICLLKLDCYT